MDRRIFSEIGEEAERLLRVRLTVPIAALRNDKHWPFRDFAYDNTEGSVGVEKGEWWQRSPLARSG